MTNLKAYLAAARDLGDGALADCKIVAPTYDEAEKKAREYFNDCLEYYEFEVVEIEPEEDEVLVEGIYYNDAPSNYAYHVFC